MENKDHHKISNFWFGFALGAATVGTASYLLGTKQGRKTLKKMLEFSENLEENLIDLGHEFEEAVVEKGDELRNEIKKLPQEHPTFGSLLDKIRDFSHRKEVKRFFVKEGKITEEKKK